MDGEDDRKVTRQLMERLEQIHQSTAVVDVGGAVQGENRVRPLELQSESVTYRGPLPVRLGGQKRVDHDVADKMNLVRRDSFPEKIVPAALLGDEEEVRDRVAQHSVDLFGHG